MENMNELILNKKEYAIIKPAEVLHSKTCHIARQDAPEKCRVVQPGK